MSEDSNVFGSDATAAADNLGAHIDPFEAEVGVVIGRHDTNELPVGHFEVPGVGIGTDGAVAIVKEHLQGGSGIISKGMHDEVDGIGAGGNDLEGGSEGVGAVTEDDRVIRSHDSAKTDPDGQPDSAGGLDGDEGLDHIAHHFHDDEVHARIGEDFGLFAVIGFGDSGGWYGVMNVIGVEGGDGASEENFMFGGDVIACLEEEVNSFFVQIANLIAEAGGFEDKARGGEGVDNVDFGL